MADAFETSFLGEIGIDPEMAKLGDQGAIETYETEDFDGVVNEVAGIVEEAPEPAFAGQQA
jgi:hypothetical protein